MNALIPVVAAILQAGSFTLDKVILSMRHVGYKMYLGISFPLFWFCGFILFLIFRPPLGPELFTGYLAWLLALSIAISSMSNILYYRALDSDKLAELQAIDLFKNIPIILFSSLLFADERNPVFVISAFIAAAAVIWSHWDGTHFKIARHTLSFLMWTVVVVPLGISTLKPLLAAWDPIAFLFVHDGIVAMFFWFLFSRATEHVPLNAYGYFLLTNFLSVTAWVLFFISYKNSGIVYTTLLFSLEPLLVYFAAVLFLKERLDRRKAIAFLIVLASITISHLMQG
ncbi:MAG: DMT family transporter [Patescibacteria group bacterium]